MDTQRLRSLAEIHLDIGEREGWGARDLTRELCALALEAAALLEQPTPIPDGVREAIADVLELDNVGYGRGQILRAWLDEQQRPPAATQEQKG